MNLRTKRSATILLFAAAALSLRAADKDGFRLSAGLLSAQGDSQELTGQTLRGYALQAGYQFQPEGYGIAFAPYLGQVALPGKPGAYKMAANVVGADLVYGFEGTPFAVATGPSFHAWTVKDAAGNLASTDQGDKKLKLGWRLGLIYRVGKSWSVSAAFTQTGWRSRTSDVQEYTPGLNPSRPAYWSIMADYRF